MALLRVVRGESGCFAGRTYLDGFSMGTVSWGGFFEGLLTGHWWGRF